MSAADKNGFIMIFPQTSNNCWDVGSTKSLTHDGGGDTQAVAEMVKYTPADAPETAGAAERWVREARLAVAAAEAAAHRPRAAHLAWVALLEAAARSAPAAAQWPPAVTRRPEVAARAARRAPERAGVPEAAVLARDPILALPVAVAARSAEPTGRRMPIWIPPSVSDLPCSPLLAAADAWQKANPSLSRNSDVRRFNRRRQTDGSPV